MASVISPAVQAAVAGLLNDVEIACKHFCLFKKNGSNFKNAHVHILTYGDYPGTRRSQGYDGLGHDDETPGMSEVTDPRHNTVSKVGKPAEFQPGQGSMGGPLAPPDLGARSPYSIYFYPGEACSSCAKGYYKFYCPCCSCYVCMTWSPTDHDAWAAQQK